MSRLIDADKLTALFKFLCEQKNVDTITIEAVEAIIDTAPTVDAIPTEWIRDQMCEYPGMESAMWSKLLRIWKREADT